LQSSENLASRNSFLFEGLSDDNAVMTAFVIKIGKYKIKFEILFAVKTTRKNIHPMDFEEPIYQQVQCNFQENFEQFVESKHKLFEKSPFLLVKF